MLTLGAVTYSVIGPLLLFMALEHISVPQVTIIQRLESVDILVMSVLLLGTNVSWWLIGNAALTFIGILLSILSPLFLPTEDGKLHLDEGVIYTIVAGFAYCLSMMITIKWLSKIPIPIVSLYRSVVGTAIYHIVIVAVPTISPGELNSPLLWLWMVPYGLLYVCAVQVLLLSAIVRAAPASISVGSNLIFFLSLMWAALLLKSYPTVPETFGAFFVALSIVSSVWEILSRDKRRSRSQRWDSTASEVRAALLSAVLCCVVLCSILLRFSALRSAPFFPTALSCII
jgi:drug/metabolite transporter (DMT)-like permease